MLILGEVHTGLLQHSTAISALLCERVLGLFEGERVRRYERPIAYAASPSVLTGVDCRLPTLSGARIRGVGTVIHRATITAGHVLQGSARATVSAGDATHRLAWSHYLALPGTIETTSAPDWPDVANGFVSSNPTPSTLDLGGISGRVMDRVQSSPHVDRSPPFRTARIRLRWVARGAEHRSDAGERITFSLEGDRERSLQLTCGEVAPDVVAEFCEDLALHDWLLSTLLMMIERSQIGGLSRLRTMARLWPVVDHLLHIWMPAARLDQDFTALWEVVERRTGLSRQWRTLENRIRDQMFTGIIAALVPRLGGSDR